MRIRPLLSALALALAALVVTATAASATNTPTWGATSTVATNVAAYGPFVATSGNSVMTAWIGTDRKGYANFSQDAGVTWTGVVNFSDPNDTLANLDITTLTSGDFAVAMSTSSDVRVRTTNTSGTLWSSYLSQSVAPDTSYLDVVGIADGRAAVITRDGSGSNYEAIVALTTNSNAGLGSFTQISTNNITVSTPKLAYANGVLSAVWQQGAGDLGYSSTSGASNFTTWSSPGTVQLDSTGSALQMQYFTCGTKAIVSATSPASNGYLKILSINADFSGVWSNVFRSAQASVKVGETVCTTSGQLVSLWLDGNGALNSAVSSLSGGVWSTTTPITVAGSLSEFVALAATPDGGAAAVTTQYVTPPNRAFGLTWSNTAGWSAEQSLYTSPTATASVNPAGATNSSGAVFSWREEILYTGPSQPVSAVTLVAPAPSPGPAPDPALAATGAAAGLGAQLGWAALGLGVVGAAAIVFAVRRKKRDSE